ncbi:putative rRNA maturation factor YbeY [Collimonas arenae]|uniref:Endoribonuclease YbeY n=1 Tax=Collimonas arenae TaxID=279058 RepID=A0A127QMM7_9BURK|nr:rRNA maturation RNase YbeY [Collimonas arenae]AMP01417.1 putative rRNA maturation factor YbeY [Collimonas arenae]AMP11317.1 putative rRNA maturation factor YbeY [Collimonas arenae]
MPQKNKLSLSVQYPDPRLKDIVTRPQLRRWVQAALLAPAELTLRFVDAEEGRSLNRDYRGKDYATNVLTFAYSADQDDDFGGGEAEDDGVTRADIIFCTDVLQREAVEQRKSVEEHTAHLVVHGVLHAQGYDHEDDEEAAEMENLEIEILEVLGWPNPYADR